LRKTKKTWGTAEMQKTRMTITERESSFLFYSSWNLAYWCITTTYCSGVWIR